MSAASGSPTVRSWPTTRSWPTVRSWQDEFGTAMLALEGGLGGQTTVIVAPLEVAASALEAVHSLAAFRGRLVLAVPEAMHAAPLLHAIQTTQAQAVIALGGARLACAGPALSLEPGAFAASTGLTYANPPGLPAWSSGRLLERLRDLEPGESENLAASAAAALGVDAMACPVDRLDDVLARTLHFATASPSRGPAPG